MKRAFYDFSVSPYSYDLVTFLVGARARGYFHTVLVPGDRAYQKNTKEEREFRLKNLILPLCEPYTLCATREEAKELWAEDCYPPGYTVDKPTSRHLLGYIILMGKFRTIMPKFPMERDARLATITIRDSRIAPQRNSNIPAWVEVAKWLESEGWRVVFIPETEGPERDFGGFDQDREAAVHVQRRLAYYEAAGLNLFVSNGPAVLCSFSTHRPYLIFKPLVPSRPECSVDYFESNGFPVGGQLPWAKSNQKFVWADDDADTIVDAVNDWRNESCQSRCQPA